ncbi:MAG TPA: histidine kinase [Segeticoccus sp.]|nr:histidine kinase [Segeticoccus sp.]
MTEAAGRWDRVDGWLRRHPTVPDLALAAVLAALLLPASLPPVVGAGWPPAARVAMVAVLVLLHAAVAVRRTHPVPAFGTACAVMLALLVPEVSAGAGPDGTVPAILLPSALVFTVVLYAVSGHTRAPLPTLALAVGLVGAGLTTARLWDVTALAGGAGRGPDPWFRVFLLAALVASVLAPWALGRIRRVRADHLESLRERGAREERTRIAREVHDVVAHSLAVMVSQAEGGRMVAGADPGRAAPVFTTIADTGREALTEMRSLVGVLRDGPDRATARVSPQPGLADLPDLVEQVRSSGTPVELHESGHPGRPG